MVSSVFLWFLKLSKVGCNVLVMFHLHDLPDATTRPHQSDNPPPRLFGPISDLSHLNCKGQWWWQATVRESPEVFSKLMSWWVWGPVKIPFPRVDSGPKRNRYPVCARLRWKGPKYFVFKLHTPILSVALPSLSQSLILWSIWWRNAESISVDSPLYKESAPLLLELIKSISWRETSWLMSTNLCISPSGQGINFYTISINA